MMTVIRLLSLFRDRVGARRAAALGLIVMFAALPFGSGCGVVTDDNSASFLIVTSLNAANGAKPTELSGTLASDVQTGGGYFSDPAQAKFALGMKNPLLTPTSANFITVTRYRVDFARADGSAGPVPASFESAITVTVTGGDAQGGFTLVPATAKPLAPLDSLVGTLNEINTVATVTFFGTDQGGRVITVTATIGVRFADWADPA
jgi:hypothetical protein